MWCLIRMSCYVIYSCMLCSMSWCINTLIIILVRGDNFFVINHMRSPVLVPPLLQGSRTLRVIWSKRAHSRALPVRVARWFCMAGVHFLPSPLIWIYGDDNGNDVECDKHNMSRNILTCIAICEYIQRNNCGYVFWYDAVNNFLCVSALLYSWWFTSMSCYVID